MKLLSHAKLNLFLEVTGKRANGYHELVSQVIFLDLADEIEVQKNSEIKIRGTKIKNNIILKTVKLLQQKYKINHGAEFNLTKNIPIGGGLGGGSANAATTLFALNKLWQLNLSTTELYSTALELGADVPVCLYSLLENQNTAFFSGIGEVVKYSPPIKSYYYLLVNPNKPLFTKEVFAKFNYTEKKHNTSQDFFERNNYLEISAIKIIPEIAEILESLKAQKNCLLARMTGSGATCFGVFTNKADAQTAAASMQKTWWARVCTAKQIA